MYKVSDDIANDRPLVVTFIDATGIAIPGASGLYKADAAAVEAAAQVNAGSGNIVSAIPQHDLAASYHNTAGIGDQAQAGVDVGSEIHDATDLQAGGMESGALQLDCAAPQNYQAASLSCSY